MTDISRSDRVAPPVGGDVAVAPSGQGQETSGQRKTMVLLAAVAVMLFIYFLPEPTPLERGGNVNRNRPPRAIRIVVRGHNFLRGCRRPRRRCTLSHVCAP